MTVEEFEMIKNKLKAIKNEVCYKVANRDMLYGDEVNDEMRVAYRVGAFDVLDEMQYFFDVMRLENVK